MKRKKIVLNCILLIAIIAVLFSNIFYKKLSVLLKLVPDYDFSGDTEIHFINVGQGDAIGVIFDNGETMLIDSGTDMYSHKYLDYVDHIIARNNRIDYLVLTHIDADHSSNMQKIIDRYDIGTFYRPTNVSTIEDKTSSSSNAIFDGIISAIKKKNIKMQYNRAGINLKIGLTTLNWLTPIDDAEKKENNDLCPVIKISFAGVSALLTGDIDSKIEEKILSEYPKEFLDVDILKLAHHGSAYSTSTEFLDVTSPQFACVSVGKNTYGHPSDNTLERILQYDKNKSANLYSNLYSTIDDGNVIFTLNKQIKVNIISNIDDYNFVSFFVYSSVMILVLLVLLFLPNLKNLKRKLLFASRNKKFKNSSENT